MCALFPVLEKVGGRNSITKHCCQFEKLALCATQHELRMSDATLTQKHQHLLLFLFSCSPKVPKLCISPLKYPMFMPSSESKANLCRY